MWFQEHSENLEINETPRKRKLRQLVSAQQNLLKKKNSQIKKLQQKTSRYRRKITDLKDILANLKERNYIAEDQVTQLENFGVTDLTALRREYFIASKHKEEIFSIFKNFCVYSPLLLAKGVFLCKKKIPNSAASHPNNKKVVSIH